MDIKERITPQWQWYFFKKKRNTKSKGRSYVQTTLSQMTIKGYQLGYVYSWKHSPKIDPGTSLASDSAITEVTTEWARIPKTIFSPYYCI